MDRTLSSDDADEADFEMEFEEEDLGDSPGYVAVTNAIVDCEFPATREDLTETIGDQEVDLEDASCTMRQVLEVIPIYRFESPDDFKQAVRDNWDAIEGIRPAPATLGWGEGSPALGRAPAAEPATTKRPRPARASTKKRATTKTRRGPRTTRRRSAPAARRTVRARQASKPRRGGR